MLPQGDPVFLNRDSSIDFQTYRFVCHSKMLRCGPWTVDASKKKIRTIYNMSMKKYLD